MYNKINQVTTPTPDMPSADLTVSVLFGVLGATIGLVQIILQWRAVIITPSKQIIL